jgi:hypothetical protein
MVRAEREIRVRDGLPRADSEGRQVWRFSVASAVTGISRTEREKAFPQSHRNMVGSHLVSQPARQEPQERPRPVGLPLDRPCAAAPRRPLGRKLRIAGRERGNCELVSPRNETAGPPWTAPPQRGLSKAHLALESYGRADWPPLARPERAEERQSRAGCVASALLRIRQAEKPVVDPPQNCQPCVNLGKRTPDCCRGKTVASM